VLDVRGNGKDIVRGGWGIYTDFGYTNSNVLFAAADASGTVFGQVLSVGPVTNGIRKADGTLFKVGDSLDTIRSQNQSVGTPPFGQYVDPLLQMPYQIQTNAGWSHEITSDMVFSADLVYSLGRDLNTRPRTNQRTPGSLLEPAPHHRVTAGCAQSEQQRQPSGAQQRRKRLHRDDSGPPQTAVEGVSTSRFGYPTLARARGARSVGGRSAEHGEHPGSNNPFDAPVQNGPATDTDARHRINLSASFQLAAVFASPRPVSGGHRWPVALVDGRDINLDGDATEIPTNAFAVDTFNADTGVRITLPKQAGTCATVNCGAACRSRR
jgi:hypothetical protein